MNDLINYVKSGFLKWLETTNNEHQCVYHNVDITALIIIRRILFGTSVNL